MFCIKDNKKVFSGNFKSLIRQGRNAEVMSLIKNIDTKNLMDNSGTTLLHLAAKFGNVDLIKILIDLGCDIDAQTTLSQSTPLMTALLYNRFEIVTVLLENGADVCTVNSNGKSAFQIIFNRKRQAPEELVHHAFKRIKKNGIVKATDELVKADCSLESIVNLNDAEVTREILERRISIDNRESYEALKLAMRSSSLDNVEVLLHHGPGVQERRSLFIAELSYSIKSPLPDLKFANQFVERLVDWNIIDEEFLTFIQVVFEGCSLSIVEMFLQNNIDIYVKSKFNQDLLIYVCGNPNPEVIKLLHRRNVNLNALNNEGITGLHLAVRNNLIKNVQYLLDMGADPDVQNDRGITPLFDACSMTLKNDEIIKLLLHYDADVQLVDRNEHTLIEILEDSTALQEAVFAHLAKLEARGEIIKEIVRDEIESCERFQSYYLTCRLQIEETKTLKISQDLSFFTVLATHANDTTLCLRRLDVVAALLHFGTQQKLHWYYFAILKRKLERSIELTDLQIKVGCIISECTGLFECDHLVVEKITSLLSYKDLIRFV